VAILKDRDGVITLDLPESRYARRSEIQDRTVDMDVRSRLMKKIVTARSRVGSLFGGGEEMSFIEFPVGAATMRTVNNRS